MENQTASMATRIKSAFKKYDIAIFEHIVRIGELQEFNAIASAIGYEYSDNFIEAISAFKREVRNTFKQLKVYEQPCNLENEDIEKLDILEQEVQQIGIGVFVDKYCPQSWNRTRFNYLCRQVFSHLIAEGKFKSHMATGNDVANYARWGDKIVLTKEQAMCLPRATMFRAIKEGVSHKTWEKYQKAS